MDDCRCVSTTESTEFDCWAVASSAELKGDTRATRDTGFLDKESASTFSTLGRCLTVNSKAHCSSAQRLSLCDLARLSFADSSHSKGLW